MKQENILIVDDEQYILNSLSRVLQDENRQILTAASAEEAWEMLKTSGEVKAIICDNRLPGVAGIDFFIKAKRLYPDTIRILMTGYPDLNSTIEAINKAHIWRYILKPVEAQELRLLVKQAVDYYNILKEHRLLLNIARQQADFICMLKEKYPQINAQSNNGENTYFIDEKKVTELLAEFVKKYYP